MIYKYKKIKLYLVENADPIQNEAIREHKKYLSSQSLRIESIDTYQNNYSKAVQKIGVYLTDGASTRRIDFFNALGEQHGKVSVQDGLTIEEAIGDTVYLKQAIWRNLKKAKLLHDLSTEDFYEMSQIIGIYIDAFASKIAFTYHKQHQYIERNLNYLAEASKVLSSSLDYQKTLNTIANLAVPQIADWCAIDMLTNTGTLQEVALAHKDPEKVTWVKELRARQPRDMNKSTGVSSVLRTGKPEIYPEITDKMLVAMVKNRPVVK